MSSRQESQINKLLTRHQHDLLEDEERCLLKGVHDPHEVRAEIVRRAFNDIQVGEIRQYSDLRRHAIHTPKRSRELPGT